MAAKKKAGYAGMTLPNTMETTIWPSMAYGKNVFLNVHRDDDFFWSLTTVLTKDKQEHTMHSNIATYFCFPAHGFAVALRPGDVLMFNATVDHCVSSKCNTYRNVICLSMYLKSLVVSGNDNSRL